MRQWEVGHEDLPMWASLIAQLVKNLPAVWETWVWSPGWEDPLEKGKTTHSSILAWRIPWSVQSMGSQRVGHDWATFTFRYADDTTLMAESQEELKESLGKGERGELKSWLKTQHSKNEDHGIQSHHFMGNRWGNNGNSDRRYFLGLQNHCSWWLQHEIKRCLLLGRKTLTNLDCILKSRVITLLTKVHIVKVMVFPVVIYSCKRWIIKKAERWRTDAFELQC